MGEIAAVKEKLEVAGRFASTVKKIEDLVANLTAFDNSLKAIDSWKDAEADAEVAGLKARFDAVKAVSDTWVKKCDVLVKEWVLLDNTVTELNSWVAKDKSAEGENQFSLE